MNEKPETGTVLFEVALLTVVVLLVDEWLIRGALAFIPATPLRHSTYFSVTVEEWPRVEGHLVGLKDAYA